MLPGIPLKRIGSSSPPSAVVVNCGVVWRKTPPKPELHPLIGTCWQRRLFLKKIKPTPKMDPWDETVDLPTNSA